MALLPLDRLSEEQARRDAGSTAFCRAAATTPSDWAIGSRIGSSSRSFRTWPRASWPIASERLEPKGQPTPEELSDIYEATLTLLYRLLFLLYAESRDLLPVREGSLRRGQPEEDQGRNRRQGRGRPRRGRRLTGRRCIPARRRRSTIACATLFKAMDKGDPILNVPTYNGGLFNTTPDATDDRDHRIARFLRDHKVPDRYLAKAIDRLARDQDEKTLGLVFIDFKSLEVRHLGSIYEGLLEFKLKVADEDLTTQTEKNREKYIPLVTGENQARASGRDGRQEGRGVPLQRQGRAQGLRRLLHARPDRRVHRRPDGRPDPR